MNEAPPNTIPWPPIIYIFSALAAIALNVLYPLPWIEPPLADMLFAVGILLVLGAIGMDVSAMMHMRKAQTTISPNKTSAHLVTSGPFSFTRNPIYLGNTALLIGIGLASGIVWFLPWALIAAYATQKLAIVPEERHLARRFGKRFQDYAKRVRRWL